MPVKNVETKARCEDPDAIREILNDHHADYRGTDHQLDTYFNVPEGRMKLREGNIENSLIYYRRSDAREPKTSHIDLLRLENTGPIKALLTRALGVLVTVSKKRETYFIENVKFHLDEVEKLGSFAEIEAIDEDGEIGEETLRKQCEHYLKLLDINEEDLVARSYSDMLNPDL